MTPENYEEHEHEERDDIEAERDAQREDDEASYAAHVSGPACGWRS